MNRNRWRLVEHLFHTAREIPLDERPAFLTRACGGDSELCDEIVSLLRESEEVGDFLAESVLSLGISLIARVPGASSKGSD